MTSLSFSVFLPEAAKVPRAGARRRRATREYLCSPDDSADRSAQSSLGVRYEVGRGRSNINTNTDNNNNNNNNIAWPHRVERGLKKCLIVDTDDTNRSSPSAPRTPSQSR